MLRAELLSGRENALKIFLKALADNVCPSAILLKMIPLHECLLVGFSEVV
jgi:hypothetical protein